MRSPYFMLPVLMAFAGAYYLYAKGQAASAPIQASSKPAQPSPPPVVKKVTFAPIEAPLPPPSFNPFDLNKRREEPVTKHSKDKYFTWPWAKKRLSSELTIGNETYTFQGTVAQSGMAKVKKVKNTKGQTFAVKIIEDEEGYTLKTMHNMAEIGELVDYAERANSFHRKHYAVIPYIEGVNFRDVIFNEYAINQKNRIPYDRQLDYAESFLETFLPYHLQGYKIHDVKPDNYIWDEKNKKMHRIDKDDIRKEKIKGSYNWTSGFLAPGLTGEWSDEYTIKSDVFSAGVTLMELFTPFLDINATENHPAAGKFCKHVERYHSTTPTSALDQAIWNICKEMVEPTAKKIPDISAVIKQIKALRQKFANEIKLKIMSEKLEIDKWHNQNETDKARINRFKDNPHEIKDVKDLILTYKLLVKESGIARLGSKHKNDSGKTLTALKKQFVRIVYDKAKTRGDDIHKQFHAALIEIKNEAFANNYLLNLQELLGHNVNVRWDKFWHNRIGGAKTYSWFMKATKDNDADAAACLMDKYEKLTPTRRTYF